MTDPIKAEPVAWMYIRKPEEWPPANPVVGLNQWKHDDPARPYWTETPLYTHAQLVEERRLAWNEAIEAAAGSICGLVAKHAQDAVVADVADQLGQIIRALTKDSTHD